MKNFSLKALGAFIFAAGLVVAGVAAPANATTNASPTNVVVAGGNNSGAITVNIDSLPNSVYSFGLRMFGVSFVTEAPAPGSAVTISSSSPTQCSSSGVSFQTGASVSGYCIVANTPTPRTFFYATPNNVDPLGTAVITFASGKLLFDQNAPAGGYRIEAYFQTSSSAGSATTLATIPLTAYSASTVVTFDANGGTGAMVDQSASTATNLNANAFTRSGYTFTGWNTAANGSGTAYADGASFPFTANTTLYAQWTATLATTGFNGISYLAGGLVLSIGGVALMLFARRRHAK